MKQEIVTYLSTLKNDLFNLSKFLYENPEYSFKEYKAYSYITNMLECHNFKIAPHYLDIDTAFYAEYGSGHPKVCFICEYDAVLSKGHITGHNLLSSMSIGAALSLSKIVDKIGGSLIVLGCPGEFNSGAKVTMAKQGTFSDIDVVLMAHPNSFTSESGTSKAILPLKIEYFSPGGLANRHIAGYTALDACLFTFNSLTFLIKGLKKDISIDGVIVNGGSSPYLIPDKTESNFYIRGNKMSEINIVEKNIRNFIDTTSKIMNMDSKVSLYELPYEELITNSVLSRIFCHNLKESGIIDIKESQVSPSGLSLGTVSHVVPCIHPYISIVSDNSTEFATAEFAQATLSEFAQNQAIKTSQALAITAVDIIQRRELLSEITKEFYDKINKL